MPDNWKVFAEDEGTGLEMQQYRDRGDGANFDAQSHVPNATDFAVHEPILDVDWSNNELRLTEAQYRISGADIRTRVRDGEYTEWPEVTFTVYSPETTVSFADGEISKVFANIEVTDTTGDKGQYVVSKDGTTPPAPYLLVAEIDAVDDVVEHRNIYPEGDFSEVTLDGKRSFVFDEESDSVLIDTTPDGGSKAYEVVTVEDLQDLDFGGVNPDTAKTRKDSVDTQTLDSAVVFNTEGRDTLTISVETDTKAMFAVDASVDGNDWMESWDTFEVDPSKPYRDTYHTGMPYIRVRVEDESADDGVANIVLSAS